MKKIIFFALVLSLVALVIINDQYFLHLEKYLSLILYFNFLHLPLLLWLVIFLIIFFILTALRLLGERRLKMERVFLKSSEEHQELERQLKKEKAEKNRIDKISSPSCPQPLFNSDIVFIAELYINKDTRLDSFFSFGKIISYDLKNFVTVSHEKKQLVYEHSLVKVLKMYNTLYQNNFNDQFLKDCLNSLNNLRNYVNKRKSYKGSYNLRLELEKHCKNFPKYHWDEDSK